MEYQKEYKKFKRFIDKIYEGDYKYITLNEAKAYYELGLKLVVIDMDENINNDYIDHYYKYASKEICKKFDSCNKDFIQELNNIKKRFNDPMDINYSFWLDNWYSWILTKQDNKLYDDKRLYTCPNCGKKYYREFAFDKCPHCNTWVQEVESLEFGECDNCDEEVEFNSMVVYCPSCGERIKNCEQCSNLNDCGNCPLDNGDKIISI